MNKRLNKQKISHFGILWQTSFSYFYVVAMQTRTTAHKGNLLMGTQKRQLLGESIRVRKIVIIHPSNIVSPGPLQTGV